MFWERYVELCNRKGMPPNAVAAECGFTSGSVTGWSRNAVPRRSNLKKLADYFGVSVAYLLGEEDKAPLVNGDAELTDYLEELRTRPEMRMLFSAAQGATKEDIERAVKIIAALRGSDKGVDA